MGKNYKLNKSELTRLKNEEKIYTQFLPVLKLKQEQLQTEQIRINRKLKLLEEIYNKEIKKILKNISLFTDSSNLYNIGEVLRPKKIIIDHQSLAGVNIPILKNIEFHNYFINFFDVPYWFISIIKSCKILIVQFIELKIINKQYKLISKELKKATQKVNLFEKVLIPENKYAIKKIKITLSDEQVSAVGRAKIAKNKSNIAF